MFHQPFLYVCPMLLLLLLLLQAHVLSDASYLFERGDVFLDVKGEEAKWQQDMGIQVC